MLWSKLLLVSAKTGQRTERILSEAEQVYREFSRRVPPDDLTEVVRKAETRKPFARQGKMLRIERVEQVDIRPPTFVFRVNRPDLVHFSYRRYLENNLRDAFKFTGTPITLRFSRAGGERKGKRS
jgi:GTP-binding protein